ncbi:hypothetical protein GCM10008961_28770 [Deinococcus knuensis]|uniref:Uncharacterized protein n=1 Tax=Deinococcus knuensis TaxID=1837380 RepID=A0ABQ2SNR6_9DEIO|nr:hypothetical protein GCM10008961_28770 [Deinococcus knuensis]
MNASAARVAITCTAAPRSRSRRSTDGAFTAAMLPPTITSTVGPDFNAFTPHRIEPPATARATPTQEWPAPDDGVQPSRCPVTQ